MSKPPEVSATPERPQPSANIPVTKDVVKAFSIDEDVVVMLKGKIKSIHASQDYADFTLELSDVEVYQESDNEFEKMAADEEDSDED